MYPKISIVTPSYNQGKFLEQTIDSVLSQNYPALEYFIVDGGSTDNSKEIIRKYEKHLTWWVSEKDDGQSHAINKGLKRSTGEIVNWINSDDYYEPDALRKVADAFSNPQVNLATFRANVFGLQNRINRGTDLFPDNLPKAIAYSRIDQPETFFRKSAIDRMGLLNDDLHYCMDKEWLLRYFLIFGNEQAVRFDDIILNFRYHENSKSTQYQDRFEKEADSIYLNLAKHVSYKPAISSIQTLLSGEIPKISFEKTHSSLEAHVLNESLNYYLFKRFRDKYEALDWHTCKILSRDIVAEWLDSSDRQFLKSLKIRIKLIPKFLIKLLRIRRR